jgi:hypothetical protein
MAQCVTCGSELHPERAERYDYCTRRACREQNARGLEVLAVGVNKAADQYEVVDGRTRAEAADRGAAGAGSRPPARVRRRAARAARPAAAAPRAAWRGTDAQRRLALAWHAGGVRPDEIARRLDLPTRTVVLLLLDRRPVAS